MPEQPIAEPQVDPEALARFELATGLSSSELDLVATLPVFAGLERRAIMELLVPARVRRYRRHALLFVQDEPATHFYVVLEGWVRLYRETPDGHESMIALFTRGESFAEAAIFQRRVYPVNAAIVEDARLLAIPAEHFLARLRADPELCLNMLASMSRRLRHLVQQIEHLTVRSSAERLEDFLLKLTPADGRSAVIELPWDKALIAARLGMQPETLSRSLAKLRRLGVETKGSRVTIHNLAALRQFSGGELG